MTDVLVRAGVGLVLGLLLAAYVAALKAINRWCQRRLGEIRADFEAHCRKARDEYEASVRQINEEYGVEASDV